MTAPSRPVGIRPERIKLAFVAGMEAEGTADVQALVRNRLRFVGVVFTVLLAFNSTVVALTALQRLDRFGMWPFAVASWIVFLVVAGLTAALWRSRPQSLPALRRIELLVFGLPLAYLTGVLVMLLGHFQFLLHTFEERARDGPLIFGTVGLLYITPIVGHGTLIPNTGRRCALIVTTMALLPIVLLAAIGLSEPFIRTNYLLPFLRSLIGLTLWLAAGVALAIYGSHRIDVLRQEALLAQQIGQYRLGDRLGTGGMGEVYLAEHVLLRRSCALKLIRPERAGDPKNLQRFEREVTATATLTHPNTVQIFDYGHGEDGTFYYVMEYLPGLTLEEVVNRHGPLPPARVIHVLRQVCGALHEAHGVGLVHRDIKPANVMLCTRGGVHDTAKLLDFGLVLPRQATDEANRLTIEGSIAGTPAYMSPEQAGGQEDADLRSDIYSTGALAYFLLTGEPPFGDRPYLKALAAHLYETPEPPSRRRAGVPSDLEAVVLRCLAKEPAERFPDALSLDRALADCDVGDRWTEAQAAQWWERRQ